MYAGIMRLSLFYVFALPIQKGMVVLTRQLLYAVKSSKDDLMLLARSVAHHLIKGKLEYVWFSSREVWS
jgi:hypothetical protein